MHIVPGLYGNATEGSKYNVLGVSINTETAEQCVFAQISGGPLHAGFRLIPLEQFIAGPKARYSVIETFPTPQLLSSPYPFLAITPGLYGHFKKATNTYNVIAVAQHTVTGERTVLYQPLYGKHRYQFRHRKEEMFHDRVKKSWYSGRRFFLLDPHTEPHIAAEYQD